MGFSNVETFLLKQTFRVNFWGNVTQVAGHLDFYGCLGAKGGAIYINEGHMILQGGSQDRVEKTDLWVISVCFFSLGGGGGSRVFFRAEQTRKHIFWSHSGRQMMYIKWAPK